MTNIETLRLASFPMKAIVFFCLLGISFSCNSTSKESPADEQKGWTVTIRGKVGFPQPGGKITITQLSESGQPANFQDTITLKSNYTYAKKLRLTEPGYYRLNFYDKQLVNIILSKADIEVNVDGNSRQGFFEVKNSPDLDLIKKVQEIQATAQNAPELTKINQDYGAAAAAKDERKMDELRSKYLGVLDQYNDKIAEMMVNASPSLAVINLLQTNTLDKDNYFDTYVAVADKLKKEWPDYSASKNFVAYVDKLKVTAIGQPAPEIALPDPNGNVVKLSSMKGKYVLVDFWAKWCGPCRQENPNIVNAYNRFKDKGFTVFGVSLDRTKEDWLKAIQEDNLTWTHVSDLKFWQSEAAKTYGVTGIPFSLLVDPNGVIVAKGQGLRGPGLHKKLEELLMKK